MLLPSFLLDGPMQIRDELDRLDEGEGLLFAEELATLLGATVVPF